MPEVGKMIVDFELLKVSKMTSLNLYISSHREVTNIKFGKQVNFIQRVLLGTLPKQIPTSLSHNHVILTNLFISSHRDYSYLIWAVKTNP